MSPEQPRPRGTGASVFPDLRRTIERLIPAREAKGIAEAIDLAEGKLT